MIKINTCNLESLSKNDLRTIFTNIEKNLAYYSQDNEYDSDYFYEKLNKTIQITYVPNNISFKKGRKYCHSRQIDFLNRNENIDTNFIKRYNTFVFKEIDSYSFFIIDYIIKRMPEKKIYCLDLKFKNIFNDTEISFVTEYNKNEKTCFVDNSETEGISSEKIFYSLTWATRIISNGRLNEDKTFFIINCDCAHFGLSFIARQVSLLCYVAEQHGWIPFVLLNKYPNQYLRNEKDNMWEYYFEQVTNYTYKEILKSKNIIFSSFNDIILHDDCNLYLREAELTHIKEYHQQDILNKDIVSTHTKLTNDTIQKINKILPQEIKNKNGKILGAIARGTDYKIKDQDIENFINKLDKESSLYDKIFVATEDQNIFNILKDKFDDKIIFVEQERITYPKEAENIFISDLLLSDIDDMKEFGLKYLASLFALGLCDKIIATTICGAWLGTAIFNCHKKHDIILPD